jgi:hypothetical protein
MLNSILPTPWVRKLVFLTTVFLVSIFAAVQYKKATDPSFRSELREAAARREKESEFEEAKRKREQAQIVAPLEPVDISANALIAAYDANEIAADQVFKGRTATVWGVVQDIGRQPSGLPYVVMTSDGKPSMLGVQGVFRKSEEHRFIGLWKGRKLTITCEVEGKSVYIQLIECRR